MRAHYLLLNLLRRHWFLIGLALSIATARSHPSIGCSGGPLHPEVTVKIIAVAAIFFVSGVTIDGNDLRGAIGQYRVHVFIQCFTFVVVPLFVQVSGPLLRLAFRGDDALLRGLVTLSCLPPPVSSAVILTQATGGNEAAAVFNSAFGSILGIFVTPFLLLNLTGVTTTVNASRILEQLSLTVLLPLFVGQVVRRMVEGVPAPHSKSETGKPRHLRLSRRFTSKLGLVSQISLLLIIFTTFCDAFKESGSGGDSEDDSHGRLIRVVVLVVAFQLASMFALFRMSTGRLARNTLGFGPRDAVAITFCGVHKSLTLGIPIVRIMYDGGEDLGSVCLPILVYHPTQILLGSFLVPYFKSFVTRKTSTPGTELAI